mgnify:CR=1 FL=1
MKFLLVTGSYRSGTTYLYKAFQNNKPMPQHGQEPYQEQKAQLIKCDSDMSI